MRGKKPVRVESPPVFGLPPAIQKISPKHASAWALDDGNRPLYATVPGGEVQREMAFRAGVNIVMYTLTGNYKADQVHIPALLERLGQ